MCAFAVSPTAAPRWRSLRLTDGAGPDATVDLLEVGEGDPLLFLHGWGLTPRSYADALTRLCTAGVRVIAPTLPGFGGSSPLPLRAGLSSYSAHVARLIEALDLPQPPFIVGHSLGGGIALHYAHEHPDRVRSLTLVNTVGGRPSHSGRLVGGPFSFARWLVGAASELDPREWLAPHVAPPVLRDLIGNVVRRPVRALTSAAVGMTSSLGDTAKDLVDSGLPVLFVWGDRDRLTTPGELAGVVSELGPEIVAGRHGWMLTEPAEFAGVIRDALVVHAMLERRRRQLPSASTEATQAAHEGQEASIARLFPDERQRIEPSPE